MSFTPALQNNQLFQDYAEKNKNALTLLVAQALLPIALQANPVANLMEQYNYGVVGPSVNFFSYYSTRLTADGNSVVNSPYKADAKILVKALAYMDEAHVDYLLRFPATPTALNNPQFMHIPLRRVLGKDYLTISLLQAMLGKGLRVLKNEYVYERLPDYGYSITHTTLSIVFDPKLCRIPTAVYMRWPTAVNIKVAENGNIMWPRELWPQEKEHVELHEMSHSLYMDEEENDWDRHY
jgi:hypothetical protein